MINHALLASCLAGCFVAPSGSMAAAQEDFYRRICTDSQYAYEHGYNKAREGAPMHTGWSERCAPEVRAERVNAYMAGYQAAAQPAPAAGIDIHVGANVQSGGGTTACSYDADCGPGRACRAIQGGQVCMGGGAQGDYCWYDADCLSGSCAPSGTARYCR